ncbi:hypothetical protein DEM26_18605 [Thioclava sp. NG1]|nr:hypothetical protein B6V72_17655 [Thioclava sp. F34-6]PWE48355.1 hypothetical protein DEM26_18605 [Thioclava sp. NG1]
MLPLVPAARREVRDGTIRPKRRPRTTDLAPVSAIMELQFRPAQRAGSRHLMTDEELAETIRVVDEKVSIGLPNAIESLALLREEQAARASDDLATRTARLRYRIVWEVAQERREEVILRRPKAKRELPVRYMAHPKV